MTFTITNNHNRLEASPLTRARLLLHRLDLHHLVLELGQEEVDDLVLLYGQRVQVNLLHRLDLAGLDEAAQLSDGLPLLLFGLAASTAASTTTASSSITAATVAETSASTFASS